MTMWMVRAASDSSLFQPFISQGVVAIGWADVGDLQAFSSREEILSVVRQQYPDWKKGAHITSASMLHRFSKEIEPEDAIITYDRTRRVYAIETSLLACGMIWANLAKHWGSTSGLDRSWRSRYH